MHGCLRKGPTKIISIRIVTRRHWAGCASRSVQDRRACRGPDRVHDQTRQTACRPGFQRAGLCLEGADTCSTGGTRQELPGPIIDASLRYAPKRGVAAGVLPGSTRRAPAKGDGTAPQLRPALRSAFWNLAPGAVRAVRRLLHPPRRCSRTARVPDRVLAHPHHLQTPLRRLMRLSLRASTRNASRGVAARRATLIKVVIDYRRLLLQKFLLTRR